MRINLWTGLAMLALGLLFLLWQWLAPGRGAGTAEPADWRRDVENGGGDASVR